MPINSQLHLCLFTFHNVSINSTNNAQESPSVRNLHSTMFLLIHDIRAKAVLCATGFTFHNVSINSELLSDLMYTVPKFTFHNVSINSIWSFSIHLLYPAFTFHNVSINSIKQTDKVKRRTGFTFHNVSINSLHY